MITPTQRSHHLRLARIVSMLGFVTAAIAAPRSASAATGPLCYVDLAATGSNNGNSWNNAFTDLQAALADTDCDEIWVARGLYTPGANQADSFFIPRGVEVYGGFDGTESSRSQRDWKANVTVLSGDKGSNDTVNGDGVTEAYGDIVDTNNENVVTFDGTVNAITSSTVLDGFTVTGGKADGFVSDFGGGIECKANGAGAECSPKLKNLHIIGNYAANGGGGLHLDASDGGIGSPALENVIFEANYATYGGGMEAFTNPGTLNPSFLNVTFRGNDGSGGAGLYLNASSGGTSSPTLENVTFNNNDSSFAGGALAAVASGTGSTMDVSVTNATFAANSADPGGSGLGGAIHGTEVGSAATSFDLKNVILWGNSASDGDQLYQSGGSATVSFSVVEGGCAAFSNNNGAFSACTVGTILTDDPLLATLGDYGGDVPTRPLMDGSPALNAGSSTGAPTADARGISRPQGPAVDIGATEQDYVKETFKSQGTNDGWVLESSSGSGTGGSINSGSEKIKLGDDAADTQYRGILSFDTSSLPDDAQDIGATLKIKKDSVTGTNPFNILGVLRLGLTDTEYSGSAALEATDFDAAGSDPNLVDIPNSLSSGWYTTPDGTDFSNLNLTGLTQFRLRFLTPTDSDGGNDYLKIYSGNASSSKKPKLIVEYYLP